MWLCEVAADVLVVPYHLRLPQGFDALVGVMLFEEEVDEDGLLGLMRK